MHLFVILTVLIVAFGTASYAFFTSANQINSYYKQCAAENSRNFASLVDGDFLGELRKAAESYEYQALRKKCAEEDNEGPIKEYLVRHGLWERYIQTQNALVTYLENMDDIKYLYISVAESKNATHDMYLVDTPDEPVYEVGYYEEREPEFLGVDIENLNEHVISRGQWGWLCTSFSGYVHPTERPFALLAAISVWMTLCVCVWSF